MIFESGWYYTKNRDGRVSFVDENGFFDDGEEATSKNILRKWEPVVGEPVLFWGRGRNPVIGTYGGELKTTYGMILHYAKDDDYPDTYIEVSPIEDAYDIIDMRMSSFLGS